MALSENNENTLGIFKRCFLIVYPLIIPAQHVAVLQQVTTETLIGLNTSHTNNISIIKLVTNIFFLRFIIQCVNK